MTSPKRCSYEGEHQCSETAVHTIGILRQSDLTGQMEPYRGCGSSEYSRIERESGCRPVYSKRATCTEGCGSGIKLQLRRCRPVRSVHGTDVHNVHRGIESELPSTHNDLRFSDVSRKVTTGGGMRPSADRRCSHERGHQLSAEAERTANGQFHTDRVGRQNLSFTASYIDKHPVSEHTINPVGVWGCIIHCRGWNSVRYSAYLSIRNAQRDANRSVRNEPIGFTVGIFNKSQSVMREVVA